jgi:methionine synthase II (cobalamin-independent)
MSGVEFGCLPTIIGSMPHTDPAKACSVISRYLKDIPAWPQLPKRSYLENMYVQYSEGFPGVVVEDKRIYVDTSNIEKPLAKLYAAYLENKIDEYPISPRYAAGLHQFLNLTGLTPRAVKGQVTGPVSFGTIVTDNNKKAVIWDDTLSDATVKLLRLKAGWMERELARLSPHTIIFVDEPSLHLYGSTALISLTREKVIALLEEVLGGIRGLKGVHCCGNTDWSIVLSTGIDILNFDAYNYATSLSLYPAEVKKFLDKKGTIAWGIVPNSDENLVKESVSSLKDRLEEAIAPFTRNGISFKQVLTQSLLTPSCTLAGLAGDEAAEKALELLVELSNTLRKRYL